MVFRADLRASKEDQNAERARGTLEAFAAERGLAIVSTYVETESGATLARSELFQLLKDCRRSDDVLLVEQVGRLSRLTLWTGRRCGLIGRRQVRVVALDLPTS